ncbi:MAG: hypothetical protein K5917_04965, partial [Clostridiales bacterium]|nr:hypothetical protein [Clostridiales bacterium]
LFWFKRFFGKHLPIRLVLFNLLVIAALSGGIVAFGVSLFTGLPFQQNVVIIVALVSAIICFYISNFKNKLKEATIIMLIVIGLILLPFMFFTGGGINSGMPLWFVIAIVFNFLLIEGKICWGFAALQCIIYGICILVSVKYPQTVINFSTPKGELMDIVVSTYVASA